MPTFGKKWRKSFPGGYVIEYQYAYFRNGTRKKQFRMVKPMKGPWEYVGRNGR